MGIQSPPPTALRRLFVGADGLRPGWGLLAFALFFTLPASLLTYLVRLVAHFSAEPVWDPAEMSLAELLELAAALAATWVMSRIERRPLTAYGVRLAGSAGRPAGSAGTGESAGRPAGSAGTGGSSGRSRGLFGSRFGEGMAWGALAAGSVVAGLALAGRYEVDGLGSYGSEAALYGLAWGLAWGLAFLLVGITEEILFRGYPLFTLARGIGFWPGAAVLALVFSALHYFIKPQESLIDAASIACFGLLLALMVRRTGDLRCAMGFHFAFNFCALYLFGSPNSGNGGRPIAHHLVQSRFSGPDWATGGPCGIEASVLIFVALGAIALAFARRHPGVLFPRGVAADGDAE